MHNHYKDQFFSLGGGEGARVCECHLEASMTVLCALLYHLCFYSRPGAEFMKHFEFNSRL